MKGPVIRVAMALLAASVAASPALAVASGHVVDPDGRPVAGGRACAMVGETKAAEGLCVGTDESGFYRLPASGDAVVRIVAEGFLPTRVAAVQQEDPIVLKRAASIVVRVLDAATGSPLEKAEVRLVFTTGEQMGPFPSNRGGLRIAKLPPGDVIPKARAEGYQEKDGNSVTLVAGRQSEVELRLTPR
jgi:hypothetical protein